MMIGGKMKKKQKINLKIAGSILSLLLVISLIIPFTVFATGDLVFTFDLVTLVSRAVLLPNITYSYICRANSLSHYQQRINISKNEVMRNVESINHLKATSSALCAKEYYPYRCFNIAMTDFYIACYILKRRKAIVPKVTNKEIKSIMGHPASWHQIYSFRQCRLKNMITYLIGKLPSLLCVAIIYCLGRMKKMI